VSTEEYLIDVWWSAPEEYRLDIRAHWRDLGKALDELPNPAEED
jgi:hypothetical protein